ncbi:small nuclear ribonucleoprotein [Candidatus Woesearchaeota archaeon]|nr:small nuclear ribonucleoprotein [Candidatus Woesearchaeota archaeon]
MEESRPLDTLNQSRNKNVMVDLKNNYRYIGKLIAFDIHVNVVLADATEYYNGEEKRKIGTVFIRGDTIIIITPA